MKNIDVKHFSHVLRLSDQRDIRVNVLRVFRKPWM